MSNVARSFLANPLPWLVLALLGASPHALAQSCAPGAIAAPPSFTGTVRPAVAQDINPDPDILEVELTARPAQWDFGVGNLVDVWTYNGFIPGPTLEAKIGDTLIVHLCNDLPDPTTIHWHGVDLPANMDGSHISQLAVAPGETFRYEFELTHSGTFWYHPHFQTHTQVEKGLYGVLVVRDPVEDAALQLPTSEHIFVFDDVLLDDKNQIEEPFLGDRHAVAIQQLDGREGNVLLVNGVYQPDLELARDVPHRARMLNAANSRFMRIVLQIHDFIRIGGDQGLLEEPIVLSPFQSNREAPPKGLKHLTVIPDNGVLMTPGERADIVFNPLPWNATFELRWYDTVRGKHNVEFNSDGTVSLTHGVDDGDRFPIILARTTFTGPELTDPFEPPAVLRDIEPIDITDAPSLPLMLGHTIPDWETGEVTGFIQGMGLPFHMLTPDDVHTVTPRSTFVWEVRNMTESRHNFHTHGFSFQHIDTTYVDLDNPDDPDVNFTEPAEYLENKDTLMLQPRPGLVRGRSFSITRLAVFFNDEGREEQIYASGREPTSTTSGGWLAHCHILEHSARGMMTYFQVVDDLFSDGFE